MSKRFLNQPRTSPRIKRIDLVLCTSHKQRRTPAQSQTMRHIPDAIALLVPVHRNVELIPEQIEIAVFYAGLDVQIKQPFKLALHFGSDAVQSKRVDARTFRVQQVTVMHSRRRQFVNLAIGPLKPGVGNVAMGEKRDGFANWHAGLMYPKQDAHDNPTQPERRGLRRRDCPKLPACSPEPW